MSSNSSWNASIGKVEVDVAAQLMDLQRSLTFMWVLLCTFLVLSMQLGFAMLEVGTVRHHHRMTVLVKNVMDSVVSCLAFGLYTHIGNSALVMGNGFRMEHLIVAHWAFCANAVTICSGAMAERSHILGYLILAATIGGIVYPTIATAVWTGEGWLHEEFHGRFFADHEFHDFAGSGVVHCTGGCAALVGTAMLGRRIVRPPPFGSAYPSEDGFFMLQRQPETRSAPPQAQSQREPWPAPVAAREPPPDPEPHESGFPGAGSLFDDLEGQASLARLISKPRGGWVRRFDNKLTDVSEFRPCTYLQVMGMFTLWVGWYGFNAGSMRCMSSVCSELIGVIAWNTTLAACAAGLGSVIYCFCVQTYLDVGFLCNGILAGLVSITACCDLATEPQALIIGFLSGILVFPVSSKLIKLMWLDDPVDAVALHCFCGVFGVLAAAFCTPDCTKLWGHTSMYQHKFCLPEHSVVKQLVAQAWGCFIIMVFTCGCTLVVTSLCAISELVWVVERKLLDEAKDLAFEAEFVSETSGRWAKVACGSSIARRIMRQHGWTGKEFANATSLDLDHLREELQRAMLEKADTALEIEDFTSLCCLAELAHRCRLLRALCVLRLRIVPVSEIYGLGAADLDGGQLYGAMQRTLRQVTETQREHSPLKDEVRELALAVQSQESMLQSMVRGRRGGRPNFWRRTKTPGMPPMPAVPEELASQVSPTSHRPGVEGASAAASTEEAIATYMEERNKAAIRPTAAGGHATSGTGQTAETVAGAGNALVIPASAAAAAAHSGYFRDGGCAAPPYRSPGRSPRELQFPRSASFSTNGSAMTEHTDRTVSDRSAGRLTPHSANTDTPPPSILGYGPRHSGPNAAQDARVTEVAGHLVNMLSAQQSLLAALSQAATPTGHAAQSPVVPQHAGSSNPAAANAMLMSVLQQMAAQQNAGTSTPDTTSNTSYHGYSVERVISSSSTGSASFLSRSPRA